jgi:gamma-glutamylcyclotransferase (GGCT)/AIG2-like uncharacterized protein YtfP
VSARGGSGGRAAGRPKGRSATALFVYGSLMHRSYWRHALGAREAGRIRLIAARVRGWRRCWNGLRPSYGAAVLNLRKDADGLVWGAVVQGLSAAAWSLLDDQEQSHLPREGVLAVTARGQRIRAECYRQRTRAEERMPARSYVAAVRAGARALGPSVSQDVEGDLVRLREVLRRRRKRIGNGAGATARSGRRPSR